MLSVLIIKLYLPFDQFYATAFNTAFEIAAVPPMATTLFTLLSSANFAASAVLYWLTSISGAFIAFASTPPVSPSGKAFPDAITQVLAFPKNSSATAAAVSYLSFPSSLTTSPSLDALS